MTLANWLTVARIVLIPFFVNALIYQRMIWALVFFVLAALTDILDGFVARRTRISTLGRFLDPFADKLLLVSAFIMLPLLDGIPVWVTVIVVSRDIIIAVGYLIIYVTWGSTQLGVRLLGKLTTLVQSLCVAVAILGKLFPEIQPISIYFAYSAAAVTFISALDYIVVGVRHASRLMETQNPRGTT